jgi:predicted metal-binding membrane protein
LGRVTTSSTTPSLRRLTPLASLLLLAAAAAWLGVVAVVGDMGSMPGTMGLGLGAFVAVWTLMMTAMMLPSVAPFASLYTRTIRESRVERLMLFAAGYLLVWSAVAFPAYGLAWVADRFVEGDQAAATALAAVIFLACGVYQLTPFKERCLAHCRSPLGFTLKYAAYRGRTRDLRVGVHHGAFCLGCCWALMALLVVFGLMNVAAMIALAAIVLVEKTWVWGPRFGRLLGVVALVLAVLVIFMPGIATGLHHTMPAGNMGGM